MRLVGVPSQLPLSGRIEESFLRRVEALPEATWLMVLIAAAEPAGDPALLRKAAARLGLSPDAVVSAEAEGLLTIGEVARRTGKRASAIRYYEEIGLIGPPERPR